MSNTLSASARKVQEALAARGMVLKVVELPASTHSAPEAAQAVGCQVGQIVKSLVFRGKQSRKAVLILASGANRVNEQAIAARLGEPIEKADADFVRAATGFAIGGVPPLALEREIETFIDETLFRYDELWAAAGTPHAVFRLSPADLVRISGGRTIAIT